jgi:hypothetical protein
MVYSSFLRRYLLISLCLALICIQGLGQLHRIVHAPSSVHTLSQDPRHTSGPSETVLQEASAGVASDAFFREHQDLVKCQLFDELSCAQAATSSATVFQSAGADLNLSASHPAFLAWAATQYFLARAPPLSF